MACLGIYISVPFCRSKCTYCNFASGVYSSGLHEEYVARLCADIREARQQASRLNADLPGQVDSIYLGGGTPSLLPPELLRSLWTTLRREFDIAKTAEITLECAPGQLADAVLGAMVECGVNRVSFGVQSFVNSEAAITGRLHTREIALGDVARVRSAGIARINLDLIAGLPGQTPESWQESLETLVGSEVDHASVYMLEVDEDSRLGRELLAGGGRYHAHAAPSEELTADLYEAAIAYFAQHGLAQYEISNFARPGRESLHNLKYWRRQPYLGFGLDAHSFLPGNGRPSIRFETTSVLDRYLGAPQLVFPGQEASVAASVSVHELSDSEELEEAWFLGLRMREGVQWDVLADRFGRERLRSFLPVIDELCRLEVLTHQDGVVRLTRRGTLFSNEVFARFLGVQETEACAAHSGH